MSTANGFNIIYLPTILLAFIFFGLALKITAKEKCRAYKTLLVLVAIVCALPAVMFVAYYFHLQITETEIYYNFRTIKGIELLGSLLGILPGVLIGLFIKKQVFSTVFASIFVAGILLIPHAKPLIGSLKDSDFNEKWQDQISMQSTQATCGPSSAATLLHHFGKEASEFNLARRSHTWENGTEIWYLAKALRDKGIETDYQFGMPNKNNIPYPSIAGVVVRNFGHFIAVIDKVGGSYIVGDPLIGRLELNESDIMQSYKFTGFFMSVQPSKN